MADMEWYDRFYTCVGNSPAYSKYCERVFGADFSQQGFSDVAQIDDMVRILNIDEMDDVLEIGCGNGKTLDYVMGRTGARGIGFDISDVAIAQAMERSRGRVPRVRFETGDLRIIRYPPETFDVIMSVDTLYFTTDLTGTVRRIMEWLKPKGRFAAFYSVFRLDDGTGLDTLEPEATELAKALRANRCAYRYYDYSEKHHMLMRRKRDTIVRMKEEFERESNQMLFENAFAESIGDGMTREDFSAFSTRYLYIVTK